MRIIFLTFFALAPAAFTAPLPELTALIRKEVRGWHAAVQAHSGTLASSSMVSEKWDFEQFYLQVNPYVTIGAGVVQLQISPQFGFLWLRDPPQGCKPFTPQ